MLAVLAILAGQSAATASAQQSTWPQFLGPDRTGVSTETGLMDDWPEGGPPVVWRVEGGVGMSGLAVANGRALTLVQRDGRQWLIALDTEQGDLLWETDLAPEYLNNMGHGPRATPTLVGAAAFVFTGEGLLACVEVATGDLRWSVDVVAEHGGEVADYGMASSPLCVDGLVIVTAGAPGAAVVAYLAEDGSPVWATGDEAAGYSSAALLDVAGRRQVVAFTGTAALGIDPANGEQLWRYEYVTDYECNIATPIAVDGHVFLSAGENHGSVLLALEPQGGRFQPVEVWTSQGRQSVMRNEWQTAALIDGYLYGMDNVGSASAVTHLACIEADSGTPVWSETRFGKGNYVTADGKLFVASFDGELIVVRAQPEGFHEIGRMAVADRMRQAPALVDGRLYLRDDREILCVDVRAPVGDFEQLCQRFIDQFPRLSPVNATWLGDHRYDGEMDDVSSEARESALAFYREMVSELERIDPAGLSRAEQVDYRLLDHHLRAQIWQIEVLEEWAWNPLIYTELGGSAIYNLMARDFAPLPERLNRVADRLEQFPRFCRQVRETIQPERVPKIHAETAVSQNRGIESMIDQLVVPEAGALPADQRPRLVEAIRTAKEALRELQHWYETELLALAGGEFRLGSDLYDQKLAFTLQTPLTRDEIFQRADAELRRVRAEMYTLSLGVYAKDYPMTRFPDEPSEAYQQAMIRYALEQAYREIPAADRIVETARESLALTEAFVRERDLITIPPDPLEIIVMPEFQRGVSLAYCDSPGPLDVGQKTFYAVAPLPATWDDTQVRSFLREYNVRSLHNLTVHEAMPGHFVQLALSNRYPGRLRAVLSSGVFIEGWAVYAEQMMADEGLLDGDPLMKLIARKWYLRGIANAILDQALHTEGVGRDDAMYLMMELTFQEEREAAAKWVRAQLTSTQLSTYFVGYLEHADLRRECEQRWGDSFALRDYHDRVLSFGSPPTQYVRALLLDDPIPSGR